VKEIKIKVTKGQNISSTVTDAYSDLGHKVSWANGTKRNAREPRNEKALEPVNSASSSAKSASDSLSETSMFSA